MEYLERGCISAVLSVPRYLGWETGWKHGVNTVAS
jgi:hypothetical protein